VIQFGNEQGLIFDDLIGHMLDGEEIIAELSREHVDYAPRTAGDETPFLNLGTGHRYSPCELTAVEARR
jgi:hypothetical protein